MVPAKLGDSRVGPDLTVEIDVVALLDVAGHQGAPYLQRHLRRVCGRGEDREGSVSVILGEHAR